MPASLEEAVGNLKKDHAFLLKGDVFTEDVIDTWIDYKLSNEVSADAPAATSVRVLPLLRRLIESSDPQKRPAARACAPAVFIAGSNEGGLVTAFQREDAETRSSKRKSRESLLAPRASASSR